MGRKAQLPLVQGFGAEMRVTYPDARLEPKKCKSSHIVRAFCPCRGCRKLRRKKHGAYCHCWLCFADKTGEWIDDLGHRTGGRVWFWFLTLTFRTRDFPWARKFPIQQPRPSPDFVNHCFDRMIVWIEREVQAQVDFFVTHQFGEVAGRLHLHCGLSWPGASEYRWKDLQAKLWNEAGFNRILPWKRDAGFYIGRYIGRDAARAHWDFRIGSELVRPTPDVGKQIVAVSAAPDDSSREFRRTMRSWHR
jgi:hypothetical protein